MERERKRETEDKARFCWGSGDYITRKLDRPPHYLIRPSTCQSDSFYFYSLSLLGSAILPPSRIPEQNPRTPYVVCIYLSFVSDRFLPCIWTSLLHTIYHYISHPHFCSLANQSPFTFSSDLSLSMLMLPGLPSDSYVSSLSSLFH